MMTSYVSRLVSRAVRPMRAAGFLCMVLLGVSLAAAQEPITFNVTVMEKDPTHPYYNQGSPMGYAIDGVQGKELTLYRGVFYRFVMNDVPSDHPFYISTSPAGAGAGVLDDDSVANQFISGSDALYFWPGERTPGVLYYQCGNHERMGWRIHVVDAPAGVEEENATGGAMLSVATPNPCTASAGFTLSIPARGHVRLGLHDATGNEVRAIHDGVLEAGVAHRFMVDVTGLPAGVYLYRATGAGFAMGERLVVVK